MNWTWFHRLGSPRWFYEKTSRWLLPLALASTVVLIVALLWGLGFAPVDRVQGNSYRIIYIHVPAAFLAMAGYVLMALSGAIGIIWRMKLAFIAMHSAAVIGAVLTAVSLFTGALWGKPTWGTWWVWDARITSMLILLFLYLGVIVLYYSGERRASNEEACAWLAIVGAVNLPIIYFSVYFWNSLHQGATIKLIGESSIHSSMAYPLLFAIIGFYGIYFSLLLHWMRSQVLRLEKNTRWVKQLLEVV